MMVFELRMAFALGKMVLVLRKIVLEPHKQVWPVYMMVWVLHKLALVAHKLALVAHIPALVAHISALVVCNHRLDLAVHKLHMMSVSRAVVVHSNKILDILVQFHKHILVELRWLMNQILYIEKNLKFVNIFDLCIEIKQKTYNSSLSSSAILLLCDGAGKTL